MVDLEKTLSEDTFLLLDCSPSMWRNETYNNKKRIENCIRGMLAIVKRKVEIDEKDRYSLITFSDKGNAANEMYYSDSEIGDLLVELAEFGKITALGEGLSAAIQQVLKQMRFIGEKMSRVILFTDGKTHSTEVNPTNVAKIAVQLGINIDVFRVGDPKLPGNLTKRIAEMTGGKEYFVGSENDFNEAVAGIAKKKEKPASTIFNKKDESDVLVQEMMAEIADVPAKFEDLTHEQQTQVLQKAPVTCSICYMDNCMVCDTSFFGCGRFCPNCLAPFHIHCAVNWAEQQMAQKGIKLDIKLFRCVHCFYLIKVPVSQVEKKATGDTLKDAILEKLSASSLGNRINEEVCNHPNCGVMFDSTKDTLIYRCSNCNALFHADCAKDTWNNTKQCSYCKKTASLEN